ncbi:MAG: hypothetical protein FWF57_09935 [Defluviitaleaceae bacterium]|nr:hypothetical protein [Defluviitaleaceae bacterium]
MYNYQDEVLELQALETDEYTQIEAFFSSTPAFSAGVAAGYYITNAIQTWFRP